MTATVTEVTGGIRGVQVRWVGVNVSGHTVEQGHAWTPELRTRWQVHPHRQDRTLGRDQARHLGTRRPTLRRVPKDPATGVRTAPANRLLLKFTQ